MVKVTFRQQLLGIGYSDFIKVDERLRTIYLQCPAERPFLNRLGYYEYDLSDINVSNIGCNKNFYQDLLDFIQVCQDRECHYWSIAEWISDTLDDLDNIDYFQLMTLFTTQQLLNGGFKQLNVMINAQIYNLAHLNIINTPDDLLVKIYTLLKQTSSMFLIPQDLEATIKPIEIYLKQKGQYGDNVSNDIDVDNDSDNNIDTDIEDEDVKPYYNEINHNNMVKTIVGSKGLVPGLGWGTEATHVGTANRWLKSSLDGYETEATSI